MASVSGKWNLNAIIEEPSTINIVQKVTFTSEGSTYYAFYNYSTKNYLGYCPTPACNSVSAVYVYSDSRWCDGEELRTVDFGETEQTVSDEFYTWLTANAVQQGSEPEADILYTVNGSSLTAIADAIRAKKETTAIFTLEQMAAEIEGIVVGNDLPIAEETSFGTAPTDEARIITNAVDVYWGRSSGTYYNINTGGAFTLSKNYAANGFHYRGDSGSEYKLQLWDVSASTKIYESDTIKGTGEWKELRFASPINLIAGKQYIASMYSDYAYTYECYKSGWELHKDVTVRKAESRSPDTMPTIGDESWRGQIDIILAEVLTESGINEYKIQTVTLRNISDEIRRICGITGTIHPSEMLTALQSIQLQDKSVTPTTEVQTVTPDSGYFALSSVTVGAITEENEAVTEIVNEKMEVVANDTY